MTPDQKAAFIADYEANEEAARQLVPGGFLLPEDVMVACVKTALKHGIDAGKAGEILIEHWLAGPG